MEEVKDSGEHHAEKLIEAAQPKKYEVKIKKKNSWVISTVVLAIIVIILLVINYTGLTGSVVGEGDAASKLVDYLNTIADGEVTFVSSEDLGDLYEVMVSYRGDQVPVYITKDGEYFVQGITPLTGQAIQAPQQQPADIPKSDKPIVELFVMTHCPYGTQAEKGFIPAIETLGESIDAEIRFVHYFLHDPEEEETPRQVCIREEQPDKYLDYLKCFLEDGDADRCITEAKVSKTKLNSCIKDNADGYYETDSALSSGYGVRGSPTLIVNGQEVASGRSAAAYLSTICSAFNDAPSECEEVLESATPSPGFGYETSGAASSAAQC